MHDLDRAMFEAEAEAEAEYGTFGEAESSQEQESQWQESQWQESQWQESQWQESGQEAESQEVALAAELLEVTTEAELDRFLNKLVSGAVSTGRGFAQSGTGRAVGGALKSAAKQALPQFGQAVGDYLAPGGAGGAVGHLAGQWLSSKFELGLETEGLSAEDREYETARAFVRFANETAQRASRAGASAPPAVAAQRAAIAAAQRHLPGLVRPGAGQGAGPGAGPGQRAQGRWVRRGNRILILDA